ncbi:MAG TPA: ABC transporter ATP-binding protein [Anaerolineales bacterium]|nr:ABC transporter ATP-binding protein [Anaerolineales bacterium]HRQ92090.1 ABC transporter ATP-binding protein [Anaerolineales bacterium]
MNTPTALLRISGLSKSYEEAGQRRPILRNVDLEIQPGEFVALLGSSGSGKSTFLNLISGIDLADVGEIWMQGQNLVAMNEAERTLFRRNHIGFVFQFFNLLPTLTVLENVTLPAELRGIPLKQAQARAAELLAQVGLAGRESTFPDRLSGGEQQRVAIARALSHDPLLVLADEPTGNLDEETGTHIMALLEQLTRQAGKNLVMATHNLENARLADRVLRMHEGKLVSEPAQR